MTSKLTWLLTDHTRLWNLMRTSSPGNAQHGVPYLSVGKMVLLHAPRVLSTCLRGALQPSKMGATHIYRARVNALFDIDQFLHMNNASYLVHLELARWEMGVATGFATHLVGSGASFVVASAFTRFRKELKPLQPFEIHSTVHGADERSMWFLQLFHAAGADSPPVAAGLCRAVLRKGREVVSPRELLGRLGLSSAALDALAAAAPRAEHEALSTLEKVLK